MNETEQQKTETPGKPKIKNAAEVIQALREEAAKNRVLNAICHIFALRERARNQITVGSLRQTMYKEGFRFSIEDISKVLRFMANLGIGKIHYDRSGKVHALKDIKMTLKSIGLAAVGKDENLEAFNQQAKFINLPRVVQVKAPSTPSPAEQLEESPAHTEVREMSQSDTYMYAATLVVTIEGKSVPFALPRKITTEELGKILSLQKTELS